MHIRSLDHFVLVVKDAARTCSFYSRTLGMKPQKMPNGRWALHFGEQKINLQEMGLNVDPLARRPTPGAADFCLLTDVLMDNVIAHLEACGVEIFDGPARRIGATGPLLSIYFYDPDDNMVELSNLILGSAEQS